MSPTRALLLAAIAVAVTALGGRWACSALASEETKVRWRIEAMVDGFNDCKASRVLRGVASDYRDQETGATREDVHAALAQLFFERVDSRTHEFRMRAELAADELAIDVEPLVPPRATVALRVSIHERSGDGERLYWDARITGRMEKRDGGWQWVETTGVNHRERRGRR